MKNRLPSELPASLKNIDIKAVLRKHGVYAQQTKNLELKRAAMPFARQIIKQRYSNKTPSTEKATSKKLSVQFTNEQLMSYWEKQIHIVETVEQHFEKKIEQFIVHVEKAFLDHLDTEVTNRKSFVEFVNKDYFADNEDELMVQAQIDFTPLLENVATLAGQEAMKLAGSDQVYLPFDYRKQIVENVNKFTKSMLDTDRDALINLITNGLQDGKSIPEIRTSIQETFDTYSKTQAQRITRTEVIRASNQASLDAYEQSGVVEGKQWLTAGATDECAAYEGQIEWDLHGNFYDSDNEFQDGDPPIHPNCRCVLIPVVDTTKAWQPESKQLYEKIEYLESLVDKRTKAWKELKELRVDDEVYIKSLEKHLGINDEPT